MKQRYRLFRRGWGTYYCEDAETGKQESLKTRMRAEAMRIVAAKNEAHYQPLMNLQIARAYIAAADPAVRSRTWQFVMDEMAKGKQGVTRERWLRGVAQKPFDLIRNQSLVETRSEQFFETMNVGTVSTNIYLRRLHNFALDMSWLLAPVIPRRKWPAIHFKAKRAITADEHRKILAGESNIELRHFYELLRHLGGSQSDTAALSRENIDTTMEETKICRQVSTHTVHGVPANGYEMRHGRSQAGPNAKPYLLGDLGWRGEPADWRTIIDQDLRKVSQLVAKTTLVTGT